MTNKRGHVCGKFREDQLDRVLVSHENKQQRFSSIMSLMLSSILLGSNALSAQSKDIIQTSPNTIISHNDTVKYSRGVSSTAINGRIIDAETLLPLEFASIMVRQNIGGGANMTNINAASNQNGYFELSIPNEWLNLDYEIHISKDHFVPEIIPLNSISHNVNIGVLLKRKDQFPADNVDTIDQEYMLNELEVIGYSEPVIKGRLVERAVHIDKGKPSLWQRIKKFLGL
jgi:hypothetical protein